MKKQIATVLIAVCAALTGATASFSAQAQREASVALSLMPVASVVGAASLSVAGAVLTVKAVEVSAEGTVYLLERAADGAQASIRVLGRAANGASLAAGSAVTVSVIGSGVLLLAAGEVLAFVPSAIGQALLHNERLL